MSMMYNIVNMDPHTAQVLRNMANRINDLVERVSQLEREMVRRKFLDLPKDMSLQEQANALEVHKNTPMTYSEMRERFG